jgi:hypothetical protein
MKIIILAHLIPYDLFMAVQSTHAVSDKMAWNSEYLFGSGRQQMSGWIWLGSDPGHCRAYLILFLFFVPGPSLFTKTRRELCTLPKASQRLGKFSIFIFYFFRDSCLVHIGEVLASLPSFSDKLPNKRVVLLVAGGKSRCCRHKIF